MEEQTIVNGHEKNHRILGARKPWSIVRVGRLCLACGFPSHSIHKTLSADVNAPTQYPQHGHRIIDYRFL